MSRTGNVTSKEKVTKLIVEYLPCFHFLGKFWDLHLPSMEAQ